MTSFEETCRRDARIVCLQNDLLDHSGHVRRGLGHDEARRLIDDINGLRQANGWKHLDMSGRWFPRGLAR